MNKAIDAITQQQPTKYTGDTSDRAQQEIERTTAFAKVLKEFDAQQETAAQKAKRKSAEKAEKEAKRIKDKKISELRALIARLRAKLYSGGIMDSSVAAQLSIAENQLFWLIIAG